MSPAAQRTLVSQPIERLIRVVRGQKVVLMMWSQYVTALNRILRAFELVCRPFLKRHARVGGHPSPVGRDGVNILKYLRFPTEQAMDPRLRGDDSVGRTCDFIAHLVLSWRGISNGAIWRETLIDKVNVMSAFTGIMASGRLGLALPSGVRND